MEVIDNKVLVVRIDKIEKHPNADRLDLAHVSGWQCVTQTGVFKAGDLAVYIPIDSVLPQGLEAELFPVDGKIHLTKSRVRTIKLRGAISQGMLLSVNDRLVSTRVAQQMVEGDDLTHTLGITHYEPPAPPASMRGDQISKKKNNPFFPVYNKMSHFKNYPDLFEEGEQVVVTEKIHGTNFRAGWAPVVADSAWKKLKKFFHVLPKWEFVVGSHLVQINMAKRWNGFYPSNVYVQAVIDYHLEELIPLGYIIYGEIYGDGIQKGYTYGCEPGHRELRIYDVLQTAGPSEELQGYTSWSFVREISAFIKVPTVPIIYEGPYSKSLLPQWEQGASLVSSKQAHREGCVVKPQSEQVCWIGRKILRSINPEYLLKVGSDFH